VERDYRVSRWCPQRLHRRLQMEDSPGAPFELAKVQMTAKMTVTAFERSSAKLWFSPC
jgi:hypothetical protein